MSVELNGASLVLTRAVAVDLQLVQRDPWKGIATGFIIFKELDEQEDYRLVVKYDLNKDEDLKRLGLHQTYIVGVPNEPVPILRVEAELRFDVWRMSKLELER